MENLHFKQALVLVRGAERLLRDIEHDYKECLNRKEIDDDLLVAIKNLLRIKFRD